MNLRKTWVALLAIVIASSLLSACSPTPRRDLTAAEREADFLWLTSKIEASYAPLEYKEELHGFDYDVTKAEYLELARADQTNEEFYLLLKKFIATFKDGHMSLTISPAALPERSEVVYLGIKGHRHGDGFIVKDLLPTFTSTAAYPIKKDDVITKINGSSLKDAVDEFLVQYRDVGNTESNYTILMSALFTRDSVNHPLPVEDTVMLTLERVGEEMEVEVPWVREDRLKFQQAQIAATKEKAEQSESELDVDLELLKAESLIQVSSVHPYVTDSFVKNVISTMNEDGISLSNAISSLNSLNPDDTFEFKSDTSILSEMKLFEAITNQVVVAEEKSPMDKLEEVRHVLSDAYHVPGSTIYPAYVALKNNDGKRHAIGYIRIDSFSPAALPEDVIEELKNTLNFMRDFGVQGAQNLIIDLIDNGGGSLELGLKMASLLSSKPIEVPGLKYALNDSWLDSFERNSLNAGNDAIREIAEKAFNDMLTSFEAGELLSNNLSAHSLYPFQIVENADLKIGKESFDFKIVLLVNEMCASMCDIFTSTLKENQMALVVGQKTMGAGGNVVQHLSAPNSGAVVSLTESLVVSPSGVYLENNGVDPDIAMDVSGEKNEKYFDVIEKAVSELLKESPSESGQNPVNLP